MEQEGPGSCGDQVDQLPGDSVEHVKGAPDEVEMGQPFEPAREPPGTSAEQLHHGRYP